MIKLEWTPIHLLQVKLVVFHISCLILRSDDFTELCVLFSTLVQDLFRIYLVSMVDVRLSLNLVHVTSRLFLESGGFVRI